MPKIINMDKVKVSGEYYFTPCPNEDHVGEEACCWIRKTKAGWDLLCFYGCPPTDIARSMRISLSDLSPESLRDEACMRDLHPLHVSVL